MAAERDLYQVLGVAPSADSEEIRRAYRRLVRVLHPDRHLEATAAELQLAERRMREINEAWRTLGDPSRRQAYDATRSRESGSRPGGARPGTTQPRATPTARPSNRSSAPPRPGRSAAGRGAYWDAEPAQPGGPGPAEPEEQDELRVHPGTFFLLRRGPVIAIAAVAFGLFVVTAYITGNDDNRGTVQPLPIDACIVLQDSAGDQLLSGFLVDCGLPNDGEVVAQVKAPLDCPDDSRYVQAGAEFFCIPTSGEG